MLVTNMSDLGQTTGRGFGQQMGARGSGPGLYYGNQDIFGLGQTTSRGSGHHQGAHSGPPSLVYGNTDLFGLGKMMMPGSEASAGGESLFGMGQLVSAPIVEVKTAKMIRNVANFAAAAGGATFAFLAMNKESNQTGKVALGALGGGLAVMALLSLGVSLGAVSLD